MDRNLPSDLSLAYTVAHTLAVAADPELRAVFVGGVGTDWEHVPLYPYAVVRVESAEQPRGSVARTVRVRLVSRIPDGAAPAKPQPLDGSGGVIILIGYDTLGYMVQPIRDALAAADLGSPLESIATEYDAESQFPVQTAVLTLTFADAQAFGDGF